MKALILLILATALSYGINGSPTNVTTDGYPTKPSPQVLKGIMDSLQDIADPYFNQYGQNYPFTKEYVNRLAWVRPYNYMITLVQYKAAFDGTRGKDWDYETIYYTDPNESTIVYVVVVGGSGTFERKGNGGWFNWAWNGYVATGQDVHSNKIKFVKPPTGILAQSSGD